MLKWLRFTRVMALFFLLAVGSQAAQAALIESDIDIKNTGEALGSPIGVEVVKAGNNFMVTVGGMAGQAFTSFAFNLIDEPNIGTDVPSSVTSSGGTNPALNLWTFSPPPANNQISVFGPFGYLLELSGSESVTELMFNFTLGNPPQPFEENSNSYWFAVKLASETPGQGGGFAAASEATVVPIPAPILLLGAALLVLFGLSRVNRVHPC